LARGRSPSPGDRGHRRQERAEKAQETGVVKMEKQGTRVRDRGYRGQRGLKTAKNYIDKYTQV